MLAALRGWFGDVWHFERVGYATSEPFTQQVELLGGAGLEVAFELPGAGEPGEAARLRLRRSTPVK